VRTFDESKVFKRLRERITRPEDRFERVENGMIDGMPDVNYCLAGAEGWLELKAPKLPKHGATRLLGGSEEFKVSQANWFLRQSKARGRCALFIATNEMLLLIPGETAGRIGIMINEHSLNDLHLISSWSSPVPVPDITKWWDLRELLCK
jgi:hypothetical protein